MGEVKWTNGPWRVTPEDTPTLTKTNFIQRMCIYAGDKRVVNITDACHSTASEEQLANAKLIALAPRMAEVLMKWRDSNQGSEERTQAWKEAGELVYELRTINE